ncbi:hypothetical protein DY000_02009304 [Brassica cretica]|uniref:NADH:quinone oxidoreductase/Mrp antiporter membrane subunit domain-containing protein n=1 Tax=Brassica cretica TaxID=69181 RepID=A0ABQ7BX89_BRACR|nr:hypothetical protein DY000_02009304 [Brassica cretica]
MIALMFLFRWRCGVPSPLGWIRQGPTVDTTVSLPLLLSGLSFSILLRRISLFFTASLLLFTDVSFFFLAESFIFSLTAFFFSAAAFFFFAIDSFFFFSSASSLLFFSASRVFGDIVSQ